MNKFVRLFILSYIKNFFKKRNNSVPGIISITSISISVFSLIIVLSVMKGFEVKVKQKILESFPHIVINNDKVLDLNQIEGVKSYRKTSEDYGVILIRDNFDVVQIKGYDNKLITDSIEHEMLDGKYVPIVISNEFSKKFRLKEKSKIKILAPDFSKKKVQIKEIQSYVLKILDIKNSEFNRIYMRNDTKKKLGLSKNIFTEILIIDPYKSKLIADKIIQKYPSIKFDLMDWQTINASLFNLMKLERLSITIFLMFLIILSATNIYSNMVSFILEKKNEIGTLILLGASRKSLVLIFTFVGLFLGLFGTIIGVLLSLSVLYLIINTDIINSLSIDISFYQIEGFPIIISIDYFILISISALLAVFVSSLIPSLLVLNKDLEPLIRRNY
ncbi:ABC transporter permease [bacterium]|nr:ABC transporter permease [bacterium]|tara:strand:- start:4276 stop:5439 length:1164 start_codon:yes stop_codon:yes gene_type:complete